MFRHWLTITAADMVAVVMGMALQAADTAAVVIGTAVQAAGIMVGAVAVGELDPR